jgi:hypothetical protein
MCADLLEGHSVDLWGRLPGRAVAIRSEIVEADLGRLQEALGEEVLAQPGTATETIAAVAPGTTISWRKDQVRLRGPAALSIQADRVALIERIAERRVLLEEHT